MSVEITSILKSLQVLQTKCFLKKIYFHFLLLLNLTAATVLENFSFSLLK
jgi:hypothetical protein